MFQFFFSLSALLLAALPLAFAGQAHAAGAAHSVRSLSETGFPGKSATADITKTAQWVAATLDNQRLPFVIVDKKNAQIFVFDAKGEVKGTSKVLLGLTAGDHGLADLAGREVSSLSPAERTTPAGRFTAEPGRNLQSEDIIWLDYAAQLAIHRLRPDNQQERRAQRLATASALDNRISYGCVIVPVAFYKSVIGPVLGNSRSVVYVLPETRPLQSMLNALQSGAH